MFNANMLLKILGMLGGRKFVQATVSSMLLGFMPGLSTDVVMAIAGITASFILGQAYADGKSGGNTSTTAPVQYGVSPK